MKPIACLLIVALAACSSLQKVEVVRTPALAKAATLAVLPLENITDRAGAGTAVSAQLAKTLQATRLKVIADDKTQKAYDQIDPGPKTAPDRILAMRVGQLVKADAVLYGSLTEVTSAPEAPLNGSAIGLSLRIVEVASGRVIFSGSYTVRAGGRVTSAEAVASISQSVADAMASRVGQ